MTRILIGTQCQRNNPNLLIYSWKYLQAISDIFKHLNAFDNLAFNNYIPPLQSSWRWEKWQQHTCAAKCNTQNPAVRADIYLSSWITRYDPEMLHCPSCSNPLSDSRYQITPACHRNNCNLFLFCMKRGILWSSRHFLPKAKFPFTSWVQKVLFVYFSIVHLLYYKHLFQFQDIANLGITNMPSQSDIWVSPKIGMADHSESLFYSQNHCSGNCFL